MPQKETNHRSRHPKRVHAIGSYGHMNYGDDLFVDTILRRSADLWPAATVRTFTPSSSLMYAQPGNIGRSLRLGTAALGLFWADTIAMCGGSILQDVQGVDRVRNKVLTFKRIEALGVSLGPFLSEEAEDRVRQLSQRFERFIVRDKASLERWNHLKMEGAPPTVGGDLVALNPSIQPVASRTGEVSICPSGASKIEIEVLSRQVLRALQQISDLTSQRPTVQVLALAATPSANDLPLCKQLTHTLKREGYQVVIKSFANNGLQGITSALSHSSIVLSQRLHGGIVSYLTETPFLLVGHHAKCIDFAEDIGLNERTLVGVDDDWDRGIEVLLTAKRQAEMRPERYRERAESIYISSASGK
jgi:polysaccharide pyruvyl transferase WcaK-like protein